MSSDYSETQEALRQALLEVVQGHGLGEEGGGFLKGAAMMVEWVGGDGRRWLTQVGFDGVGDEIPDWQVQGYFHNYMHSDWTPLAETIEDDDDA